MNPMLLILNRLLVTLTIFAFIGGMTMQATPSAAAPGMPVDSGCPHMAAHQRGTGEPQPVPRSGIDPDCVKQMGCLGTASLPLRREELLASAAYSKVTYCLSPAPRAGGSVEPELLPPIGV